MLNGWQEWSSILALDEGLTTLTVKILAFLHEVGKAERNMRLDRPTRRWGDYAGLNDGEMRCGGIYIYIYIYGNELPYD